MVTWLRGEGLESLLQALKKSGFERRESERRRSGMDFRSELPANISMVEMRPTKEAERDSLHAFNGAVVVVKK